MFEFFIYYIDWCYNKLAVKPLRSLTQDNLIMRLTYMFMFCVFMWSFCPWSMSWIPWLMLFREGGMSCEKFHLEIYWTNTPFQGRLKSYDRYLQWRFIYLWIEGRTLLWCFAEWCFVKYSSKFSSPDLHAMSKFKIYFGHEFKNSAYSLRVIAFALLYRSQFQRLSYFACIRV